jgi:hypothetical protein
MLAAVFDRATEGDTGGISKLGSPPVFELHFKLGSKIPNPYGKSSSHISCHCKGSNESERQEVKETGDGKPETRVRGGRREMGVVPP